LKKTVDKIKKGKYSANGLLVQKDNNLWSKQLLLDFYLNLCIYTHMSRICVKLILSLEKIMSDPIHMSRFIGFECNLANMVKLIFKQGSIFLF